MTQWIQSEWQRLGGLALVTLPFALVFRALVAARRGLYRLRVLPTWRAPVPVIVVGNITAGGTGKTPLVEFVARWFARKNFRIAVLARGYGRIDGSADDEDLLSEMELENAVRLAGRDRVAKIGRAHV